jgi:hypothetical protein
MIRGSRVHGDSDGISIDGDGQLIHHGNTEDTEGAQFQADLRAAGVRRGLPRDRPPGVPRRRRAADGTDWLGDNPNDYFGEDGLQYWPMADSARWNDIDRVAGFEPFVRGFLVEYEP